jgi:hypothetical protein
MATIRPEVTGRSATAEIGHNGGPPLKDWIELQRIVSLAEAARLSGLSIDTIKRRHADKVIELSPRRRGIRLRDALMLSESKSPRKNLSRF